jgi:hypothetical protein
MLRVAPATCVQLLHASTVKMYYALALSGLPVTATVAGWYHLQVSKTVQQLELSLIVFSTVLFKHVQW